MLKSYIYVDLGAMVNCLYLLHLNLIDHEQHFERAVKSIDMPVGVHLKPTDAPAGTSQDASKSICEQFTRWGCTCVYNKLCHDIINMAACSLSLFDSAPPSEAKEGTGPFSNLWVSRVFEYSVPRHLR